jgi:MarR family transcriptional regulator, negative regulator of the multidrug operon emrRAB
MRHTEQARTQNLLGSAALAVVDRMVTATEEAAGHTRSAPAAIAALATFLDGVSIDYIAQTLGLTHSAAVRLIDRLEEGGLVERRRGADGRSVSVVTTRAGQRAGERILAARERALEELVGALSASEQQALAGALESLLGSITSDREDGARICRLCDFAACGQPVGRCPVSNAADAAEALR